MATLLDSYLPYDSGPGANVTESGWRNMVKHFRPDGIISNSGNGFNVFGDSSGMQVKIDTGECWLGGQWGQSTALKVEPVANNATGAIRLDRVILRNDFVNNNISTAVLTGTSPTILPAVTQNTSIWEIPLGFISVPNGAVTITAGNVTFEPQNNEFSLAATASQAIATNTATTLGWNSIVLRSSDVTLSTGGLTSIVNGVLTFNRSGLWQVNVQLDCPMPTSGASVTAFRMRAPADTGTIVLGSGTQTCLADGGPLRITAGTQYSITVVQQTGNPQVMNGRFRAAFIRE